MSLDKKQIYIVDDDESVRRSLGIFLGTFGFEVRVFSSATEYFNLVPDSLPGCLILDVHMPGLDGWATLERMRTLGSRRPVIVISADKNRALTRKAANAGAVGYLQKPFDGQALVDLINVAFEKKKRRTNSIGR